MITVEDKFPFPLNVACPKCEASAGIKCIRKQLYPKPWKKHRKQLKALYYVKERMPHRERIYEGKIQNVCDSLDKS